MTAYGAQDLLDWTRFEEYLERLEQAGSTLNLATQVGHGTVRSCVMGFDDRAPTPEELDRMRELVAESLDAGALGFSTGLYYAPGSYARTDEVVVLSREVAIRDKLYSTHMRDERDFSIRLFGSVEESLAISRFVGVLGQSAGDTRHAGDYIGYQLGRRDCGPWRRYGKFGNWLKSRFDHRGRRPPFGHFVATASEYSL